MTLTLLPSFYLSVLRSHGEEWTRPSPRLGAGYLPLRYLATPSTAWWAILHPDRSF